MTPGLAIILALALGVGADVWLRIMDRRASQFANLTHSDPKD